MTDKIDFDDVEQPTQTKPIDFEEQEQKDD